MLPTRALVLVCSMATSVVLARSLGPSGRGVVAVGFGLSMLLVQVGNFGFTTANPYFTARDPLVRGRIVANSLWLALVGGALLVVVGAVIGEYFPSVVRGLSSGQLILALSAIPAVLGAQLLQAILLGERKMVAYNATELGIAVFTLIALTVGLLVFDLGVWGALAILVGTRIVAALMFLFFAARGVSVPRRPDTALARKMIAYSLRVYTANLIAFLVIRLDLLLVNGFLGTTQAGLYAVAVSVGDALYIVPAVVAVNLFVQVAHGLETDASARVFRLLAPMYAALCLGSALFADVGIRVVFGSQFADAAVLYQWLAPGIFALGMLNVLAQHFAGRGYPLEAVLIWFVGLAINLAINLLFLDHGTYVAALSSSVAYVLLLALHMRLFKREAGSYRIFVPRRSDLTGLFRVSLRSPKPEPGA
jgi:O-antigen/teichoic acid export membrane protein